MGDQCFPYAQHGLDLPPNAPSRILVDRLHVLGISFRAHGFISDQFGSFNLLTGNYLEIKLRLSWCWQAWVADQVRHRADFAGLEKVNLCDTRKALAKQLETLVEHV